MSDTVHPRCPRCGRPVTTAAPEGLCPACLGALNFATETSLDGLDPREPLPPLSPAELAPHFPQLEILQCLGRGGMGVVYQARQKSLNRLVALKLLAPERVQDEKFAERFAREARALAALNHPNIVTVHDFGQAGGFYFLLMEFVDGVNLRQLLRTRRLQPSEALAIVPPVCEALQYAHDHGIVHRDIKPENLLLAKDGRVKIADFGIAKMLGNSTTVEGGVGSEKVVAADGATRQTTLGTPQYMAPEQREQPPAADHRADIYSLGVVLYELLTGELPADKLQPPSRKVQIDVRLDEIVLRALEKTPALRYQTAGELRTQLEILADSHRGEGAPSAGQSVPAGARNEAQRLLKITSSPFLTPAELATFSGQFFAYQTRGQLILDDHRITHTRAGHTTVIPLTAIRDVSLGQYPRSMNPAGIALVSLTYEDAGQLRQVLLSPMDGWVAFPSTWDANAADWHAAIRTAVKAATGREPTTTPREQLGITGGFPWLQLAIIGVPLAAGLGLFLTSLSLTGKSPRSVLPVILTTLALTLGFILPSLFIPWATRRRAASGVPPATPAPSPDPEGRKLVWLSLLVILPMGLLTVVLLRSSQPVASAPPLSPTTEFLVSLLGLVVVVPFLTLYLLPRWGRPRDGAQSPNAPRRLSLWPSLALSAFCAPLLVHLLLLPTVQVPPEPTHAVVRLVFSFPGALLLAALAGTGLWLRHRREPPPAVPGARPPLLGYGLALLFVPLLIHLLMLPAQLLLPEPARRGAPLPIGVPEAIILAVLGVVGLIRLKQPPAVAKSPGRNLLGLGLICFGMFLGGMKIQETYRDHVHRVNALTIRIPSLQQEWIAAGNEVFAANTELSRHIAQEPLARTDGERQRFLLEQGRLEGEVSKAKVRQDIINGQIRAIQDSIDARRAPTVADFLFVLKWSLPFVLAGMLVLTWRGRHAEPNPGSAAFAAATVCFFGSVVLGCTLIHLLPFRFPRDSAYFLVVLAALVISSVAGWLVSRTLRQPAEPPRWLRPLAVLAFIFSLPVLGFAAFFAYAMANESGGWNPAPSEALLVTLTLLGAVMLPWAGACLWRASLPPPPANPQSAPPPPHISPGHASLLLFVMPVLLVGFLFLHFYSRQSEPTGVMRSTGVTQLSVTPVGVSNNVVIVDVTADVERGNPELRAQLAGPALSAATEAALADTFLVPFTGTLVKPTQSAGNALWRILSPGRQTVRLGFVLPDAALARQAAAHLQPIRTLPSPPVSSFVGRLFEVQQTNGQVYLGSLQVELLRTAADPGWVTVSTVTQHDESNVKRTWEILASQPGTARFRRESSSASASLERDLKTKLHRVTASVELTRVSATRVRLVVKEGYSSHTEEVTGNFRELADELLRSKHFSAKTSGGTPIELCRVQGKPLTVTVDTTPPAPAATRASASGKSGPNAPVRKATDMRLGLLSIGVIVLGLGGMALLVWLLRKGGASTRTVLLVLAVPLVLLALAIAALIGWKAMGGMRLEKFERMQLHANHTGPLSAEPPGRVQQTQNGFRLQLPAGQLAIFELLIRQANDSLQLVPALTALVATSTNASFHDTLYWTLRRLGTENTSDYWSWSVTAHDGSGGVLPQLTDHGTNFSHALASGDSLDWWQLALPGTVTLGAGETRDLSLFRTHGTAIVRGTHPKEAILRVRCAATPTGFVTNGPPRIELGLAAHATLSKAFPKSPTGALPLASGSRLQFRLATEANDPSHELLADHQGRQSFRVRRDILLDDASVAEARVNDEGPNPIIDVTFTAAGGKRFAEITRANRGKQLVVIFGGKVLFAPVIQETITTGHAQIAGNFTLAEAKSIAQALMAKAVPHFKGVPCFKALIVCFNGKVDSGSSCSGANFQPDGTIHPKGKLTCGYPGRVSEIEWAFVEQRGDKDAYQFTRRFPADTAATTTTTKIIEFSERRVVVFEDEFQAVVISPPENKQPTTTSPSPSARIERVQGAATNGLESEWRITRAKPGWMWLKGAGENAIGQQMLLNPADGQYHGGVVVRLEQSTGHQKGPEVRARLGYGFAGMSSPWGTVTSTLGFAEGAAAFRQQLANGNKPPIAISTGQEFELLRLDGAGVTVAVTEDVSTTPTPATNPSDDPAAGSRQQKLRDIALESAAQAIREGDLHLLHEPGVTPRERTHDPETGYPILGVPVGDPEAFKLFNEVMRAHFRDQKAAREKTKLSASMRFKVLRVENPPGTRQILLHFERDTNAALGLEVWQDVTPSPGLHKQPQPGTYLDSQMKTWLGVNHARVLRWTLPIEFNEAEVRAVVKDIEQRAKVWRALDEGHVLGVATVTHRDGWKYHLVATVKRASGLANPPSQKPAAAPLIRREVKEKTPDGKDVAMTFEELQRDEKTSTVTVKSVGGSSVGSAMFIVRGAYEIAKARGAAHFINLKEWNAEDGKRMYLIGFASDKNVDPKIYFDLKEPLAADKRLLFLSVAAYERIFKDQP